MTYLMSTGCGLMAIYSVKHICYDHQVNRRIFINKGADRYQIFSFTQHVDGSIYCSSDDFAEAKWLGLAATPEGLKLDAAVSVGDGKLSLHGTGMVTIRGHQDPKGHELIVHGNMLKDGQELRARHLFTVFRREPARLPINSPAFNRKNDYSLQAEEELRPFVLAFFAVPLMATSVDFRFSLEVDQMVNIPNDVLGLHEFELRYHRVIWFAYRTKHLDKWPKQSHYCYSDGYWFPVFIGDENSKLTLQFRQPKYALVGNDLIIDCTSPEPTNPAPPV